MYLSLCYPVKFVVISLTWHLLTRLCTELKLSFSHKGTPGSLLKYWEREDPFLWSLSSLLKIPKKASLLCVHLSIKGSSLQFFVPLFELHRSITILKEDCLLSEVRVRSVPMRDNAPFESLMQEYFVGSLSRRGSVKFIKSYLVHGISSNLVLLIRSFPSSSW